MAKRISVLILIITMILSVSGCSGLVIDDQPTDTAVRITSDTGIPGDTISNDLYESSEKPQDTLITETISGGTDISSDTKVETRQAPETSEETEYTVISDETAINESGMTDKLLDHENADMSLLASLPEYGIYLYGNNDKGVILYYNEIEKYFDWYPGANYVMPQIMIHDYDNDDINELAVVLHIGSGTGVSVDELHILEISEIYLPNNISGKPDDFLYEDIVLEHDTMLIQQYMKTKITGTGSDQAAVITFDSNEYKVFLAQYIDDKIQFETVVYGDIFNFELSDTNIIMSIALGLICDKHPIPIYFGIMTANVLYGSEGFKLSDFTFAANNY
jgi:hypothetical protein